MSSRSNELSKCVPDSNVWIKALTEDSRNAISLRKSILSGEQVAIVSAYIYEEVRTNLLREFGAGEYVDELQTQFALLMKSPYIVEPDIEDLREIDLETVRASPEANFLEQVLQVQEKDAPIVTCAWRNCQNVITIYTADRQFSEFKPYLHNLNEIKIKHIRTFNRGSIQPEERYGLGTAEIIEETHKLERTLQRITGNFENRNKDVQIFANSFTRAPPQIRRDKDIIEAIEGLIGELEHLRWKGSETEETIQSLRSAVIRQS